MIRFGSTMIYSFQVWSVTSQDAVPATVCDDFLKQGCGNYLLSRTAWIVHYRWRAAKTINFILKFYLHLTMRKSDFFWITKYLIIVVLRFDVMFYSNMGSKNSGVGHIKGSRGPQAPRPCYKVNYRFLLQRSFLWMMLNLQRQAFSKRWQVRVCHFVWNVHVTGHVTIEIVTFKRGVLSQQQQSVTANPWGERNSSVLYRKSRSAENCIHILYRLRSGAQPGFF